MYKIVLQILTDKNIVPKPSLLRKWAKNALADQIEAAEVTIRIVDEDEMTALNGTYRGKPKPTNVLSFPFQMPDGIELPVSILGDLVICAAVVNQEAAEQNKTAEAHWAHMITHGILHLMGYDHEEDAKAEEMEALEVELLDKIGFKNPYEAENI